MFGTVLSRYGESWAVIVNQVLMKMLIGVRGLIVGAPIRPGSNQTWDVGNSSVFILKWNRSSFTHTNMHTCIHKHIFRHLWASLCWSAFHCNEHNLWVMGAWCLKQYKHSFLFKGKYSTEFTYYFYSSAMSFLCFM